jgi:hypothetical protein
MTDRRPWIALLVFVFLVAVLVVGLPRVGREPKSDAAITAPPLPPPAVPAPRLAAGPPAEPVPVGSTAAPPRGDPPPAWPIASGAARAAVPGAPAGPDTDDTDADVHTVWPATVDGIRGAMQESFGPMKDCYVGWVQVSPQLAGKLTIAFTITPEDGVGRIDELHVADSDMGGHQAFEACLLSVLGEMEFDPPAEPTTVNYPLMFTQRE